MDLNARPYRAFVRVAELRSISRAAASLNVSQPALSAQLRELERQLGFALFHRTSRRVDISPEGALFLDKARRMITETDWINQAARDIRLNQVRIGAAHFTGQITERCELIERFTLRITDVPIQIVGRHHAQLLGDLARNDIDLAVTIEIAGEPDCGAVQPEAAGVRKWVAAERPVRVLRRRDTPPIHDTAALRGLRLALPNRSHGVPLSEAIARRFDRFGVVRVFPPEADGPALMRHAAVTGCAAVDLGWFGAPPASLVSDAVAGLDLATRLIVIAPVAGRRAGADRFIAELEGEGVLRRLDVEQVAPDPE